MSMHDKEKWSCLFFLMSQSRAFSSQSIWIKMMNITLKDKNESSWKFKHKIIASNICNYNGVNSVIASELLFLLSNIKQRYIEQQRWANHEYFPSNNPATQALKPRQLITMNAQMTLTSHEQLIHLNRLRQPRGGEMERRTKIKLTGSCCRVQRPRTRNSPPSEHFTPLLFHNRCYVHSSIEINEIINTLLRMAEAVRGHFTETHNKLVHELHTFKVSLDWTSSAQRNAHLTWRQLIVNEKQSLAHSYQHWSISIRSVLWRSQMIEAEALGWVGARVDLDKVIRVPNNVNRHDCSRSLPGQRPWQQSLKLVFLCVVVLYCVYYHSCQKLYEHAAD